MKRKTAKLLLGVGILVVGLAIGLFVGRSPKEEGFIDTANNCFFLAVPAFAQEVSADRFPGNEVGISAYVDLGEEVDLARARSVFKGIEADEEEYIIGIVELPDSAEDMWPHAYVGRDGWLIAYYPKSEPTSRLFQWVGYQRDVISTTTLKDTLVQMCQQMALDSSKAEQDLSYCHFQYPDATKLLFVVDTTDHDWDEFYYTVPRGLALYDASWSHYAHVTAGCCVSNWSGVRLNDEEMSRTGTGTYVLCGDVPNSHRLPDRRNTGAVGTGSGWAGLALLFIY